MYSKLTELGHEVIGIDNFFHPSKNPQNKLVQTLDIRDINVENLVAWSDIVYHLAAQIHVDYSIQHPVDTFDINVNGSIKILEACKEYKKKLVFASTSEIYGSAQNETIAEWHPKNPQSPYAVSKLTIDNLCQVYKDLYGTNVDIIRNFNTFGPYQNDTSYGGVIAIFTRKALENEPLEIFGSGTQERDYMYIDDALQGYLLSLNTDLPKPMNFGTGKTITINELAHLIKKITNSDSPILYVTPRLGEVQKLQADISLASSYGFQPTTDFERDLTRYINWYKEEHGGESRSS